MKKFVIQLFGGWVLKHWEDEVSPSKYLEELLVKEYPDLKVKSSSFTEVEFLTENDDFPTQAFVERTKEAFAEKYGADEIDDALEIYVEDDTAKKSADGEEPKTEVSVAEKKEPKTEASVAEKKETKTPADLCMEKIGELIGGEEFKTLAEELVQVAPQIVQNKTYDAFSYQSYLFSINEGYGLSTYLKMMSELLSALKIRNNSGTIREVKLLPPKGTGLEPFERALEELRTGMPLSVRVLCIDISEWMNAVNTRVFKEFLMTVERHMNEFIVVFRIPFVGKEVLDSVEYALNDLMFVRTVSFPPFTREEIRRLAKNELERYGFKMSAAAWEGFDERISEEKRDGKFYGLNTIRKVVRELLYKKQLSNAKRGKKELCICKRDTAALCMESGDIGLSGEQMLDKLVGCAELKDKIREIVSQIEFAYNNPGLQKPCIHMRFVGNPGTGKTTVARIVGKLLREKGVLRIGNFFEYAGRDFCGQYIGETAPKTSSMCRDAYGSVLFIDEAYSLYRGEGNDKDYGKEALDTLIAEMENHRSDLVVIMAGYTDEMETLMRGNAGLASRMPYVLEFPNFSREQLYNVFVSMLEKQVKYDEDLLPAVKAYFESLPDELLNAKEFSNARFVRNLFERTWAKAALRCQLERKREINLTKDDFDRSASDKEFKIIMKKKNRIGFVE